MEPRIALTQFYHVVKHTNPTLAALMSENIVEVALGTLHDDKTIGQRNANELREKAEVLDEALRNTLNRALVGLGYS